MSVRPIRQHAPVYVSVTTITVRCGCGWSSPTSTTSMETARAMWERHVERHPK